MRFIARRLTPAPDTAAPSPTSEANHSRKKQNQKGVSASNRQFHAPHLKAAIMQESAGGCGGENAVACSTGCEVRDTNP